MQHITHIRPASQARTPQSVGHVLNSLTHNRFRVLRLSFVLIIHKYCYAFLIHQNRVNAVNLCLPLHYDNSKSEQVLLSEKLCNMLLQ